MNDIDREKLAEENMNLVYYTIKTYYPTFIGNEEVIGAGMYGLARACNTFDPDKGFQFSTYAVSWIKKSTYKQIVKEMKRNGKEVSLEVELKEDYTLQSILVGQEDALDVSWLDAEAFIDTLNEREKFIISLLKEGYTQQEIGDSLGLTHQRIGQIHRNIKLKWGMFNEEQGCYSN